jgi:ABC-type hemin transport system ATPase subunit
MDTSEPEALVLYGLARDRVHPSTSSTAAAFVSRRVVPDQPGEKVGQSANGAGKSTVFRLIAGEEQPDDGTIEPEEADSGTSRQDVGDLGVHHPR